MNDVQKFEALKEKLGMLNTQRTRLETRAEAAKAEYNALAAEAQEKYGTADLDGLRAKLREIQAANEASLAQFEASIGKYAEELAAISQSVK